MFPGIRSRVGPTPSAASVRRATGCGSSRTTRRVPGRPWSKSCGRWASSSTRRRCRRLLARLRTRSRAAGARADDARDRGGVRRRRARGRGRGSRARRRSGRDARERTRLQLHEPRRVPSTSSKPAPSSTPSTRTAGGRPSTARCSTQARSSPASSTRPTPKRSCSASRDPVLRGRAPRTRRGSEHDVDGRRRHRRRTSAVPGPWAEDDPRPHGQVPSRRRRASRIRPTGSSRRSRSCPTGWSVAPVKVGVDLIEIGASSARTRALPVAFASAVSRRRNRRTATRARIRRRAMRGGSPARKRLARRSGSESPARSLGGTSRSPDGRSPRFASAAGSRPGRSASEQAQSICR